MARRNGETQAAIRRRLAWEKSCQGWSQQRIADHLGVTQQQISVDLAQYRASLTPLDREEMRRQHHEQLRMMRERMFELTELEGSPLTAGKDGDVVYDPETGGIARDYGGRIAATREWRMLLDREAKLADLDEKINRTETTVDVTVHTSVDAELESLAAELGLNDGIGAEKPADAPSDA